MSSTVINNRVNFASVKNPMPYPDFLDVQLKSFKDFLQLDTPSELRKNDGLYKVFAENFPIADTWWWRCGGRAVGGTGRHRPAVTGPGGLRVARRCGRGVRG